MNCGWDIVDTFKQLDLESFKSSVKFDHPFQTMSET